MLVHTHAHEDDLAKQLVISFADSKKLRIFNKLHKELMPLFWITIQQHLVPCYYFVRLLIELFKMWNKRWELQIAQCYEQNYQGPRDY